MSGTGYSVVLRDVSLIDVEDFKSEVPADDLKIIQPDDSETHNELATFVIIALTAPALTAFTLWLLRTWKSELIEYDVTVRKPDGSEMSIRLKIRRSSSEAPAAQVIQQVADALKLPRDTILAASSA